MMKLFINIITTYIIISVFSTFSQASETMLTLKDLHDKCSHIIVGRVESVDSFYINNDKSRIYTSVKVVVDESVKGYKKRNAIVEIIFYGGTLDGRTTTVLGLPTYHVGEETLLFLKESNSDNFGNFYMVFGGKQGKFNIKNDGKVTRNSDFPLLNRLNGHFIFPNHDSSTDKSTLLQEIRQLAN